VFRAPIEKHGDKAAQAFLLQRVKPFMLQRTQGGAGETPHWFSRRASEAASGVL